MKKTTANVAKTATTIYQTSFEGTNLPKGIYFCTLTTRTQHYTTKIMLVQ